MKEFIIYVRRLGLVLSLVLVLCPSMWAQKKPTLMILPSDNWCLKNGYTIMYNNQGTIEKVPNYKQAFQEDTELRKVISSIGEIMIKYGYRLKDAEMELKNISKRTAEDNVTFSKTTGAQLAESPLDVLKRRAKADIIIQIEWNTSRITSGRSLHFTIEAFDAYTSKRISTTTSNNDASNTTIQNTLEQIMSKQIKAFDKQLDKFYGEMGQRGREIKFNIRVWENSNVDLETEFNGEELLTIIQQWLSENTVRSSFNLTDQTENMAEFEQVMIPLKDLNGKDVDARSFIHKLQIKLKSAPYFIDSKLMMRGLGESFHFSLFLFGK